MPAEVRHSSLCFAPHIRPKRSFLTDHRYKDQYRYITSNDFDEVMVPHVSNVSRLVVRKVLN